MNLNVMLLNAENLFVFLEKYTAQKNIIDLSEREWQGMSLSLLENKNLRKVQELALLINRLNPDILMLTEVGGATSMNNFNLHFLKNEYSVFTLDSNSNRGIDMGFLIKKSLPFNVSIKSYKDYPLDESHKKFFSRDLLELMLEDEQKKRLYFYLVHLKSKLNLNRDDFEGRSQRSLEIKALTNILSQHSKDQPIILAGDFNGQAGMIETEPEFLPLYNVLALKDVSEVANLPKEERFSYIYFSKIGQRLLQQIDYAFLNNRAQEMLVKNSVCYPRFLNLNGTPYPIPSSLEFKKILPSDHYPLWFQLEL